MTYWTNVVDYTTDRDLKEAEFEVALGRPPSDRELYRALNLSKATFYRWEEKRLNALAPDITPPSTRPERTDAEKSA